MTARSDAEIRNWQQSLWFIACAAVLLVQILTEYIMGRVPICTCGYVKLFEPVVNSSGNSQHVADWYTPSHIIHGFLFFGLTHLIMRGKPLSMRLSIAMLIESGWEILENSPIIINRYRAATISLDYVGDSIMNSAMDAVFMVVGFLFASHAPVLVTVAVAIFFELLTGWLIRDNLTLNVIMLLWPVEAIKTWQGGL
ncbi:DUF2585 domain-containing protein [Rhizobium calliandrae]|uniref:UPF0314 protein PY650_00115 n=1 Tax=Rhizobium calliandrae TaxID=1312182 RepID=A0ABT7K651_9HYPH|nr:DUF2585 domain-containing protein [Rhizobium calliandrae]MDL2404084.1 DUF2585 domain-containing protein [Rhizobium calliandrae]